MKFTFDNERPIYIQLVEQLQIQIISGKLALGEKLLSVRELASQLQINPNTVQRALSELEDQKLINTQRTNGKFVTTDKKLVANILEKYAKEKAEIFFKNMDELGFSKKEAINYLVKIGGIK